MPKSPKKAPRTDKKILPLGEVLQRVALQKKAGKIIVHCHGVFDLLHPGHIRHFLAAKREGDVLVVTLTPDRYVHKGPGRPVFTEHLRAESVAALEMVDYVAINEWPTAVETIKLLRPDVYAKGSDYRNREDDVTGGILAEEKAVQAYAGRLHFTDDITFSSSKLLNAYFSVLTPEARQYLHTFAQTHDAKSIHALLQKLQSLRVLIVGEAIIDEYHLCKVLGRASKADCLNAKFLSAEAHPGGALAVANHVAGFCKNVDLLTVLGEDDSREEFIRSHLLPNVRPTFMMRPQATTIIKRRFLNTFRFHKMFEVSFLDESPLPPALSAKLHAYLSKSLQKYDLVIVADFGHGMLDAKSIALLSGKAKFLAVNAQTNSANTGYNPVTKYPRADYVSVDQEEIRLAYHDRTGPLDALVRRALKDLSASAVSVTCGHEGSVILREKGKVMSTPVFSTEVVDTIGAGDAYLSITAPCAAMGYPPDVIGFLGNAAGALAIRVLGNREPVNPIALAKFIDVLLKQ